MSNTTTIVASDFLTGTSPMIATDLAVQLSNIDGVAHTVIFSIYTNNAGFPGSLIGSFATLAVPGGQFNKKLFSQGNISLAVNTPYWLGMVLGEPGTNGIYSARTGSQAIDSGIFSTIPATLTVIVDNGTYTGGYVGNLTYSLSGTSTPEPASAVLLGLGALLLAARRRRVTRLS